MAFLPDHPGFDSTGTIRKCLAGEKWGVGSWKLEVGSWKLEVGK